MKGFVEDILNQSKNNTYFRKVLETGKHTQVVIMSIPAGDDIGEEVHNGTDQVLYLVEGEGKVILDGEEKTYKSGDIVLVHDGTRHNFKNTGTRDLKIITMYSPAHHPPGTIHKTKEEAEKVNY